MPRLTAMLSHYTQNMESVSINSLSISTTSLKVQTDALRAYLEQNYWRLVYDPALFSFDYDSYSSHYQGLTSFVHSLPADSEMLLIGEKLQELPPLDTEDFTFFTWRGIPAMIIYSILLPFGIVAFIRNYLKLSALQDKINDISRTLGTAEFMLKAVVMYG